MSTTKFSFLLLLLSFHLFNLKAQDRKVLNVKDFGAIGNGVADDYLAFQKCFTSAVAANSSVVIIPYGKYVLSSGIVIRGFKGDLKIQGVIDRGMKPSLIVNSMSSGLIIDGISADISVGNVEISGLILIGNNVPFGSKHPFFNTVRHVYGIGLANLRNAKIFEIEVRNFYGRGINVFNTNGLSVADEGRFHMLTIQNSDVVNCWGYHKTVDDYGDGVYIASVKNALIKNNRISNNILQTKHLGRGGVVIEYQAENCVIEGNYVSGYNRGIHIEDDYGGHILKNNIVKGSIVGIYTYNKKKMKLGQNKPITIESNVISNELLYRGIFDSGKLKTSGLITLNDFNRSREGSKLINNVLIVDGNYLYNSDAIVTLKSDGYYISSNRYNIKNRNKLQHGLNYFNYSNSIPNDEEYNNINMYLLNKDNQNSNQKIFLQKNKMLNKAKVFTTKQ